MSVLSDIEGRIFTERRIRLVSAAILAANVLVLAWALLNGTSVMARDGGPNSIDFACFYASDILAGSAQPTSVYDYAAFSAAQTALFGPPQGDLPYFHFLYPPTFLIFTYGFGLMPYFVAFTAWTVCTFLLYQVAAYTILPRPTTLIAAAVPLAALKNAQLGQNGFLTAGLIGLGLVLMERRPVLGGVFVGLLTYKPQFGVLFPLALIAAGRWRVIASAAVTGLILAVAAAFLFGHDVWAAYFASLRGFDARLSPDYRVELLYQSVFGWLHWYGASAVVAWTAHLIVTTLMAAVVCTIWFLPSPYPLKAAALCVGAVAATPFVFTYDLCILTMATAFLVQDGLSRGFRVGERTVLLLCLAVSFLLTRPIGPVLYVALLGVTVWRALAYREHTRPPIGPPARRWIRVEPAEKCKC